MRSFTLVLVTMLAACDQSAPPPGGLPDGGADPDAAGPLPPLNPPQRGFQIVTPTIEIAAGDEVTYCYYFRAPNTTELAIKKWASRMTAGSHHMIVYLTPNDLKTPGTLSTEQCGFVNGNTGAKWTYSAQTVDAEAVLPPDDGAGMPVGQPIRASQSGFIQMHYFNASDEVIRAHVELNAHAYDEGVQVTPAGPFITYNDQIRLESGSRVSPTTGQVSGNCTVAPDSKFYVLSTHSHKQSVRTFIKDGNTTVFESTSWDHPGERAWSSAPFFTFTSGKLSYQCEYRNPNNYEIRAGDRAEDQEMCMAIGYYFPAIGGTGHFCLNSFRVY